MIMYTKDYCPQIRNDLFGLTKTPFIQSPSEPWLDESRKQVLHSLNAFLQTRGFAAIAGKPGTGKTAIVKYLIKGLHQPSHQIVYIPLCHLSENDLLRLLCTRFNIEPLYGRSKMIGAIQQRIHEMRPVKPVIIFDEMQNASIKSMDLIRMLANDHFDPENTLSSILIGTSEFFDKLRLAIHESLRQRITYFQIIDELDEDQTKDYIRHCLAQNGAEHAIFEPSTLKLIHDLSAGILRIINKLAAAAMIQATEKQSSNVCLEHLHAVKDQVKLPTWKIK